MLVPKKVKHRKRHKEMRRLKGVASSGTKVEFGTYGLKTLDPKWLTSRQLEAARRAIIRHLRKGGKMWTRVFPDKPVTKKGLEVPMGGGKGTVDRYVAPVRPGRIIFELDGIEESVAREAFSKASDKLPVKTKFVKKK
ncbi:MAG: 50S ribosomal protein L16 [Patescibacteria group bacterium]